MPVFTWADEYSVNVPEIDAQHKKLMDMINRLYEAMENGCGSQVVGQILDDLVVYTQNHFTYDPSSTVLGHI